VRERGLAITLRFITNQLRIAFGTQRAEETSESL
jgi:hypothetical protein